MTKQVEASKTLFDECLGQSFDLEVSPSERLPIQLICVEHVGSANRRAHRPGMRESFSLVFCAPNHSRLAQGIYPVAHPRLGQQEIFLVPIGPDPEGRGMRMEAVYNFVS